MNRAIFPASNPPAEDGEYLVYREGEDKPAIAEYDVEAERWIFPASRFEVCDVEYWEELPQFDPSLVIGEVA